MSATLLTVSEAADLIGLTPIRIRQLESAGKLISAMKIARGERLFDPVEVRRFIEKRAKAKSKKQLSKKG